MKRILNILIDIYFFITAKMTNVAIFAVMILYQRHHNIVLAVAEDSPRKSKTDVTGAVIAFYAFNNVTSCFKLQRWLKVWSGVDAKKVEIIYSWQNPRACQLLLDDDACLHGTIVYNDEADSVEDICVV